MGPLVKSEEENLVVDHHRYGGHTANGGEGGDLAAGRLWGQNLARFQQAGITVGVKPIALRNGMGVRAADSLRAGKGADQHEQC